MARSRSTDQTSLRLAQRQARRCSAAASPPRRRQVAVALRDGLVDVEVQGSVLQVIGQRVGPVARVSGLARVPRDLPPEVAQRQSCQRRLGAGDPVTTHPGGQSPAEVPAVVLEHVEVHAGVRRHYGHAHLGAAVFGYAREQHVGLHAAGCERGAELEHRDECVRGDPGGERSRDVTRDDDRIARERAGDAWIVRAEVESRDAPQRDAVEREIDRAVEEDDSGPARAIATGRQLAMRGALDDEAVEHDVPNR